jgi:hypothetical protein
MDLDVVEVLYVRTARLPGTIWPQTEGSKKNRISLHEGSSQVARCAFWSTLPSRETVIGDRNFGFAAVAPVRRLIVRCVVPIQFPISISWISCLVLAGSQKVCVPAGTLAVVAGTAATPGISSPRKYFAFPAFITGIAAYGFE